MSDPWVEQELHNLTAPGPANLHVLTNPTTAQLVSIPAGVDMVMVTHDQCGAGPFSPELKDQLVAASQDHGHVHAFIAYLPAPERVLTPEEVMAEVREQYAVALAMAEKPDAGFTVDDVHGWMLERAVQIARLGMTTLPF